MTRMIDAESRPHPVEVRDDSNGSRQTIYMVQKGLNADQRDQVVMFDRARRWYKVVSDGGPVRVVRAPELDDEDTTLR